LHVEGVVNDAFNGVSLAALVPFILQSEVDHLREKYSQKQPLRGRSYPGCLHAIVGRTRASHDNVVVFVDEWLRLNTALLAALEHDVVRWPYAYYR
jgi:hypothetical protein